LKFGTLVGIAGTSSM